MERHFTVPVAIAAAFHGLLFGIPGGSAPDREDDRAIVSADPVPAIPLVIHDTTNDDDSGEPGGEPRVRPSGVERPEFPDGGDLIVPVVKPAVGPVTPGLVRADIAGPGLPGVGTGVPGGIRLPSAAALDNLPRARVQIAPDYPVGAKRDGRGGDVTVEFVVDEKGFVLNPRVVNSSDAAFEEPALRAIRKWKFEPGRMGGIVVPFRMAVPLTFRVVD